MVEAQAGTSLPPEIQVAEYSPVLLNASSLRQIEVVYEKSYKDHWLGKKRAHFFKDSLLNTSSIPLLKENGQIIGAINYNASRMIMLGLDPAYQGRRYQGRKYGEILLDHATTAHPDSWATIAAYEYAIPMFRLFTGPGFGFRYIDDLDLIKHLFTQIPGTFPDDQFNGEFLEDAWLTGIFHKERVLTFTHSRSVHNPSYRQVAVWLAA